MKYFRYYSADLDIKILINLNFSTSNIIKFRLNIPKFNPKGELVKILQFIKIQPYS